MTFKKKKDTRIGRTYNRYEIKYTIKYYHGKRIKKNTLKLTAALLLSCCCCCYTKYYLQRKVETLK